MNIASQRWYAVYTKPHKEQQVRDLLQHRDIEAYLPLISTGKVPTSPRRREKPFFACYLFARLDLNVVALSSLNWSPGVVRVVGFGDTPAVVPEGFIASLRNWLAHSAHIDHLDGIPLRPQSRLRVTAGPLKGCEAIFDRRLSSEERARVLVDMLGRWTTCELPLAWLRPA